MFWVVEDSGVRHLRAWSCADARSKNTNYWWCPEAGFSGSTKHHFFATEFKARLKLAHNLAIEKAALDEAIKQNDCREYEIYDEQKRNSRKVSKRK